MRELQFDRLEQLLQELLQKLREAGVSEAALQQLEREARENREALAQQIGREVGNGLQQREAEERRRRPVEDLQDRPFEELKYQDDDDMRAVINRLAAQLRTRVALRQKRANKGTLDAKSTIRANLRYSGVPLDVRHRRKHLKPRITVICDVSGSMRAVTGFMLMLVYALQDQISRTRPLSTIARSLMCRLIFNACAPKKRSASCQSGSRRSLADQSGVVPGNVHARPSRCGRPSHDGDFPRRRRRSYVAAEPARLRDHQAPRPPGGVVQP